jgi:hypothetical protein
MFVCAFRQIASKVYLPLCLSSNLHRHRAGVEVFWISKVSLRVPFCPQTTVVTRSCGDGGHVDLAVVWDAVSTRETSDSYYQTTTSQKQPLPYLSPSEPEISYGNDMFIRNVANHAQDHAVSVFKSSQILEISYFLSTLVSRLVRDSVCWGRGEAYAHLDVVLRFGNAWSFTSM